MSQRTELYAWQVFQVLDRSQCILLEFLTGLVNQPDQLCKNPNFKSLVQRNQLLKTIHYKYPEVGLVIAALSLADYTKLAKHSNGWIAQIINISSSKEKQILKILEKSGYIIYEDSKYRVLQKNLDTRGSFEGSKKLRPYYLKKAIEELKNLHKPLNHQKYVNFVFAVSDPAEHQINQAIYEFFNSLKNIIHNDRGEKKYVRFLNLQNVMCKADKAYS